MACRPVGLRIAYWPLVPVCRQPGTVARLSSCVRAQLRSCSAVGWTFTAQGQAIGDATQLSLGLAVAGIV